MDLSIDYIPAAPGYLGHDYIPAAPRYLGHDEKDDLQSLVFYEAESSPKYDWTTYSKEVKVDWSCALCLVSTSSEKSLKQHIKGRKHKLKEDEERKHEMIMDLSIDYIPAAPRYLGHDYIPAAPEYLGHDYIPAAPGYLGHDYIPAAPRYLGHDEKDDLQSLVFYEAESSPKYDWTTYSKEVKVDWSCALCLVSTSSEKSLKQHIKGRKHKLKEDEERKHEMIMDLSIDYIPAAPGYLGHDYIPAAPEYLGHDYIPAAPEYLGHDYIPAAPEYLGHDEKDDLQSLVFYEAESFPKYDWTTYSKEVKVDWSCALCLVSTSSEKSLKQHIKGRKHKLKEDEERKHEMIMASKEASKLEGNYLTDLLESLNQLKSLKFVEFGGYDLPIRRPVKFCTWKKPEPGWIKLNTDGSLDRKRAGLGGLLRDYEGVAISAYVCEVPCDDIFLVELLAIGVGLTLARSIGIKMLWVESDSMSAVKTINKEQPHNQKAARCLQHIWKILKKFRKYQVTHSWRETNRAADYLAKMEISESVIVMWPKDFHSSLCKIIAEDAQGSLYTRR